MAQLLNISADYLLDDGERISFQEIREPISLEEYAAGGKAGIGGTPYAPRSTGTRTRSTRCSGRRR